MGNAEELIITIVALREGVVPVVEASIAGSITGNVAEHLGAVQTALKNRMDLTSGIAVGCGL